VVVILMEYQVLTGSALQSSSRQAADEALVDLVAIVDVPLSTQLSEGIDDDTEDHVEQDGDDYQEESQVVHQSNVVGLLVHWSVRLGRKELTHATAHS